MEDNICYICLHTDADIRTIDIKLTKFHYELCDFAENQFNPRFCYQCEQLLEKTYNFKQSCLQSIRLLNGYKVKLLDTTLDKLYRLLPPQSIGYSSDDITVHKQTASNNKSNIRIHETKTNSTSIKKVNTHNPKYQDANIPIKHEKVSVHFDTVVVLQDIFETEPVKYLRKDPNNPNIWTFKREVDDEFNVEDLTTKVTESTGHIVNESDLNCTDESNNEDCKLDKEANIVKENELNGDNIFIANEGNQSTNRPQALEVINVKKVDSRADNKRIKSNQLKDSGTNDIHDKKEYFTDVQQRKNRRSETPIARQGNASFNTIIKENCALVNGEYDYSQNSSENKTSISDQLIPVINGKSLDKGDGIKETISETTETNGSRHGNVIRKKRKYKRRVYHKKRKLFACDECGGRFMKKYSLIEHFRTHTKEKPFVCDQCGYRCGSKSQSIFHSKVHRNETHSCDQCKYVTYRKSNLLKHMRVHEKEMLLCDRCDYVTVYRSRFVNHVQGHTKGKDFACDYCDYKSAFKSSLHRHVKTHTKEKPFACDMCSYRSIQKSHLRYHYTRAHTNDLPFECDICGHRCLRKCHLAIHLKKHTKIKPFACDKCDYKCKGADILKKHARTHTNERPFACDICDQNFVTRSHLVRHLETHTGEKKLACNDCDYKTNQKHQLIRHIRRHTKIMPFACPQCVYRCSNKMHMSHHIKRHASPVPYTCIHCGYTTKDKSHLSRHARIHK